MTIRVGVSFLAFDRFEVRLLQRGLHHPDQGVAVGGQGQSLHAAVRHPVLQLGRQRFGTVLNGERRASSLPCEVKWVTNGPYSSETQKLPSGIATRPSGS